MINILVDGEKLCNPLSRFEVISNCSQLIQTLALANTLPVDAKVALVLTKLDAVDNHANASRAHSDFDGLPGKIKQQCGDKDFDIKTFKVAACPHNVNFEKGHGVEGLLKYWLNAEPNTVPFRTNTFNGLRSMDLVPCTMDWL